MPDVPTPSTSSLPNFALGVVNRRKRKLENKAQAQAQEDEIKRGRRGAKLGSISSETT